MGEAKTVPVPAWVRTWCQEQHEAVRILMRRVKTHARPVPVDRGCLVERAPVITRRRPNLRRALISVWRTSSMPKCSSNSRRNGPIAQEALLSFALPSNARALEIAQVDVVAKRCPTTCPRLLTASTTSGSGFFQTDLGWMPMSAPADGREHWRLGEDFGVGADTPSRYCDQAPRWMSSALTRAASSLPGFNWARLSPMMRVSAARMSCAW